MKVGDIVKLRRVRVDFPEQWAIGKLFVVMKISKTLIEVRTVSNLRERGFLRTQKLEVVNENR